MTAGTEFTRTDAASGMPRWLALTLTTVATFVGIGAMWALAPNVDACAGDYYGPGILPGPQPCGADGSGPALVAAASCSLCWRRSSSWRHGRAATRHVLLIIAASCSSCC